MDTHERVIDPAPAGPSAGRAPDALPERGFGALLKGRTSRNAIGTFLLKVTATGLSLVVSIVLARMLGAEGFGVYRYALAWTTLVTVPAILGLDKLVIREVATFHAAGKWGKIHGLLRWSTRWVLVGSLLLSAAAAGLVWLLAGRGDVALTLSVALLLVPITALTRVRQAALQGFHFAARGQLPERLVEPGIFLLLAAGVWHLYPQHASAPVAAGLNVVATAVAFGVGTLLLLQVLPSDFRSYAPEYASRAWRSSIPALVLVSGMFVVNSQIDQIMLGALLNPGEVGIYAVARRGADLTAFVLMAVNTAIGPSVARLHSRGDRAGLQRLATRSARAIFAGSLLIIIALVAFGRYFLALFGPEFVGGYTVLLVLCAGRLFNAMVGAVGPMLIMTGHEREVAWNVAIGLVVNVVLNFALIPPMGGVGAAIASGAGLVVVNALQALAVRRRLGVDSSLFRRA